MLLRKDKNCLIKAQIRVKSTPKSLENNISESNLPNINKNAKTKKVSLFYNNIINKKKVQIHNILKKNNYDLFENKNLKLFRNNKKNKNKNIKNNISNFSHFLQKFNLTDVYIKNNIIEKIKTNKYALINKNIENKYKNNLVNNNSYNSFNKFNLFKNNYNDSEYSEEENNTKRYTTNYRLKMVDKLNEKINKDNIVDESLSELKSERILNTILEKNSQENKNFIITNNNFIYTDKSEQRQKVDSKLRYGHRKEKNENTKLKKENMHKIIEMFNKNKKSYLIIKDLLNYKLIKKRKICLKKSFEINKDNMNKNINKNKIKNDSKNKRNIFLNKNILKLKTLNTINKFSSNFNSKFNPRFTPRVSSINLKKIKTIFKNITPKNSLYAAPTKTNKTINYESFSKNFDKNNNYFINKRTIFYNEKVKNNIYLNKKLLKIKIQKNVKKLNYLNINKTTYGSSKMSSNNLKETFNIKEKRNNSENKKNNNNLNNGKHLIKKNKIPKAIKYNKFPDKSSFEEKSNSAYYKSMNLKEYNSKINKLKNKD